MRVENWFIAPIVLLAVALGSGCGDGWEKVPAGTAQSLKAVWGSSSRDVWAVGRLGAIVHFDGDAWSESPSGVSYNLHAVWGSGPEDVWIVQANNAKTLYSVLHWDGRAWSQVPLGRDALPELIAGSGPSDVWMTQNVLDGQKLLHFTGSRWEEVKIEVSGFYVWNALLVTGPSDLWLIGRDSPNESGFILHYDGTSWKPAVSDAVALSYPEGAWASSASDIWVAGAWGKVLHYDGSLWSEVHGGGGLAHIDTDMLNSVWGGEDGTIWAVGDHGVALRSRK